MTEPSSSRLRRFFRFLDFLVWGGGGRQVEVHSGFVSKVHAGCRKPALCVRLGSEVLGGDGKPIPKRSCWAANLNAKRDQLAGKLFPTKLSNVCCSLQCAFTGSEAGSQKSSCWVASPEPQKVLNQSLNSMNQIEEP